MCDYSLHLVASRAAKVGDELVTAKFDNSLTRGFAAIGEPNVAVCLLPGTEVGFEQDVDFERVFGILPIRKLAQKVARNFDDYRLLAESDRSNVDRLLHELGRSPAVLVPYLDEDVHDIAGLVAMNEHLFAADAVAA